MEYINDSYVLTNKISDFNLSEMRNNMDESDQEEFDRFIERNWGADSIPEGPEAMLASATVGTKKRGRKPKTI